MHRLPTALPARALSTMEGQSGILVALSILPFVDLRTMWQLRVASRIFDGFETDQHLAFALHQRARRLAQMAEFFLRR